MPNLEFDPTLSSEENIERFFAHLTEQNPDFANLLKTNIAAMSPFPSETAVRTTARVKFNTAVLTALDSKNAEASSGKSK